MVAVSAASALAQEIAKKPWSVSGSVGFQYDDNVTTSETDTTSNQSDVAALIDAGLVFKPDGAQDFGLELGYDFSQSLYYDLTDFNLQSHLFSASVEKEVVQTDLGLNYLYGRTFLGGDDFLGLHSITPTLGRSLTDNWYLSLRYNYQNKDFIQSANDGRDAHQNAGVIDNFFFFMDGKAHLLLGYRAESEYADGSEFDYFGHIFRARLKLPLSPEEPNYFSPTLKVGLKYADKDYSSVTPSIGAKRSDQRTTFDIGLDAKFGENFFTTLKYEYINAESNLSSSDFEENIITISIGARF